MGEQIYSAADPEFWASSPKDTTLQFMARVHEKLGPCQYSGPTNWLVTSITKGTFVTIKYHAKCHNAEADETLVWSLGGGSLYLYKMDVQSPVLAVP